MLTPISYIKTHDACSAVHVHYTSVVVDPIDASPTVYSLRIQALLSRVHVAERRSHAIRNHSVPILLVSAQCMYAPGCVSTLFCS